MGKKSLVKSTSKKRTASPKKDEKKGEVVSQKTSSDAKGVPEPVPGKKPGISEKARIISKPSDKDTAMRDALEKASVEKAATEKADAERVVPEKPAVAEDKVEIDTNATEAAPPVQPSAVYDFPPEPEGSDPLNRGMLIAIGICIFLFMLIIGASVSNTGRYYAKATPTGLEIWQGKFAPLGEKLLTVLPDMQAPEMLKAIYTKNDIFPLIFTYYLDKADLLLEKPGIPDLDEISALLDKALSYASSKTLRRNAMSRINTINQSILLYKASVAQNRGTLTDLENALQYLKKASRFDFGPAQAAALEQQIVTVTEQIAEMKAELAAGEKTSTETPPEDQPKTPPEAQAQAKK